MTKELFSRKIITALLMSAAVTAASAQEPEGRDLDRRVEVSREYMPDMDRAAKLTIQPLMNDTVSLRPDLDYTVNPAPWYTGFGVSAINPVRVDAARFEQLLPFYAKAGFGIPSRSVLDIYGTTTGTSGGYAGGYINHKGQWSKLKNDVDLKERALESNNSVGIFGRAYLGRRIALSAEIGYDYDIYSRYGFLRYEDPADPRKSALVSYSVPRMAVNIGNDFTDMSFLNFSVGAEGYLLRDRNNGKESGIKTEIAIGKRFGVHQLMLSGLYDGFFGGDARDGYDMTMLGIRPSYRITGDVLDIGASVELLYTKMKDQDSKTYFLPSAAAELKLDGAFRVFADLRSVAVSNSYRSITSRNPYVSGISDYTPGYEHPARDYKVVAGIRGDVNSNFAYELRAGGGMVKDVQYMFYYDDVAGGFITVSDKKLTYFTAGASLTGRISESFGAGLEADYFNYSAKNLDEAPDLPGFKGNIFFKYNHRDKLFLKLNGGLTGSRHFGTLALGNYTPGDTEFDDVVHFEKSKTVFDLGLEAEYRLTDNLGVWLSGDNLFNSKLYPYYHYRGFGISITAGVKVMF